MSKNLKVFCVIIVIFYEYILKGGRSYMIINFLKKNKKLIIFILIPLVFGFVRFIIRRESRYLQQN